MSKPTPTLKEFGDILGFSGQTDLSKLQGAPKYAFPTSRIRGASPELAYPAIVGLVFPFIEPAVLGDVLNRSNVKQALNDYAEAYTGTFINSINWLGFNTPPNFASFEHISQIQICGTFTGYKESK